jgi:uncharacterized surface anchored protein
MTIEKITQAKSLIFVVLLLFAFASLATPALAQKDLWNKTKEGVQKGAEGVKKGAEIVGEKTVEGAQAVGRETKKIITGEDESNVNRQKGSEVQRRTPGTMSSGTTTMHHTRHARELPATGGELLLFALAGGLCLASAGVSRRLHRR